MSEYYSLRDDAPLRVYGSVSQCYLLCGLTDCMHTECCSDDRSYHANGFVPLSSLIIRLRQHQVKLERRHKWPKRITRRLLTLPEPAQQRHLTREGGIQLITPP